MLPALLVAAMLIGISAWLLAANSSLVRASYDWSQSKLIQADFTNEPVAIVYLDLDSFLREKQKGRARCGRLGVTWHHDGGSI